MIRDSNNVIDEIDIDKVPIKRMIPIPSIETENSSEELQDIELDSTSTLLPKQEQAQG